MTNVPRRQRGLFEIPSTPMNVPIDAQQQMLELLKELLIEARRTAETDEMCGEDSGEQDHA